MWEFFLSSHKGAAFSEIVRCRLEFLTRRLRGDREGSEPFRARYLALSYGAALLPMLPPPSVGRD